MFLRPHHFQAAQRHWFQWANTSEKWDVHYNWGLRSIDIDLDALATSQLLVRSLKARLRDGTLISTDDDGQLTPVSLKEALDQSPVLTVFLAIPLFELTKANIGGDGAMGARYSVDSQDLEDENTGINPQLVQVRRMNFKLLLSTQNQSGYEVLPIARIAKSTQAAANPELDKTYIPPALACDAWRPLKERYLEEIAFRITKIGEAKARRMIASGITPESHAPNERLLLDQLRILNDATATLAMLSSMSGLHPVQAYLELWRIVGQLAIFDRALRRPPALVSYDHDDLWKCFEKAREYVYARLDDMKDVEIIEIPFKGDGPRMQVSLESRFLEQGTQMYVGVLSKPQLQRKDCDRILNRRLEMKMASSQRVDDIFRLGERGLNLTFCDQMPPNLVSYSRYTFFEIDRASQPEEWTVVQKSLNLAIRLRTTGDLTKQPAVVVSLDGQSIGFQFSLFIIPKQKQ
jgi:type VI secretion system protein ImpJ